MKQLALILCICFLLSTSVWAVNMKDCTRKLKRCLTSASKLKHFVCYSRFHTCRKLVYEENAQDRKL
ncbi:hypothetical protein ScPMuIL_002541 [Solemya velum]